MVEVQEASSTTSIRLHGWRWPALLSMQIMPTLPRLYQDHLKILEAMRSKDPDLAETSFIHHNENVLDQIKKDMELADKSKKESRQLKDKHGSLRFKRG